MNPDTTPTPRTDAKCYKYDSTWQTLEFDPKAHHVEASFARQLERELFEKTNEVARLRELLNEATDLIADIMWDEVNAIDECEKFIRAYAPDRLKRRLASEPEESISEDKWEMPPAGSYTEGSSGTMKLNETSSYT